MIFRFILIGLMLDKTVLASASWECVDPYWLEPPKMEDDIFVGSIGSECNLYGSQSDGLETVAQFIRHDIEASGKYTLHSGPISQQREFKGALYDFTDVRNEDGESIKIRQNAFVGTDRSKKFIYTTESTKIEASGIAAYLQKVSFSTSIEKKTNFCVAHFENVVRIERPWFAIGFVFRSISKDKTRAKFVLARDKLLEYLAPHF